MSVFLIPSEALWTKLFMKVLFKFISFDLTLSVMKLQAVQVESLTDTTYPQVFVLLAFKTELFMFPNISLIAQDHNSYISRFLIAADFPLK